MNKEIKAKWLEALRSGKYEQGICILRSSDDEYCCLGVLCDVVDSEGWSLSGNKYKFHEYSTALLPTAVSRQTEISGDSQTILTEMNDSDNKSFAEIADWIEENL